MSLATEVLAKTLVRACNFPMLSSGEIDEARRRLSNAFQDAWVRECTLLGRKNAEAGSLRGKR